MNTRLLILINLAVIVYGSYIHYGPYHHNGLDIDSGSDYDSGSYIDYEPPRPKTIFEWKKLEFGFPNDKARVEAEASGNLIPTNAIPIDVQPNYIAGHNLRIFVTIPKFQDGIPYTLATVSNVKGRDGPVLQPYPNYEMHQTKNGTNCDAITSAFRMVINECNQMWVIDSGFQGTRHECPPQLLLIDLATNEIIHRHKFDSSLYTKDISLFINPAVNVRDPPPTGKCKDTMVYIADVNNHGLVVYNYKENRAWRIENSFMYPEPHNSRLTVADKSFDLMDGIFSLVTDKKNLYFHPLASKTEYSVPLRVIDNRALFENNNSNMSTSFRTLGKRESQSTVSAIDTKNNVYSVTLQPIQLTKWPVNKPYRRQYIKNLPIVPKESEFVSGMKVIRRPFGCEELWFISNRFQNMATGTQKFNETNFRIIRLELDEEEEYDY